MTFAIMVFRTLIKPFVLNGLIPSHYSLYTFFVFEKNSAFIF